MAKPYLPLFGRSLLDPAGGLVNSPRKQHAIHSGNAFMSILSPSTLAGGAELQLILVVPKDVEIHVIDLVYAISKISVVSTRKLTGTFALTGEYIPKRLNMGRNSRAPYVKCYTGYTGTPSVEIQVQVTEPKFADEKQPVFSGSSAESEEFIYGEGTYLFGLLNNEVGAASGLYWKVRWNEEKIS